MLNIAPSPKVGSSLLSRMPTTVAAYLPGTLGFIRLTNALLVSTLLQVGTNAVAEYLKPYSLRPTYVQVLNSIIMQGHNFCCGSLRWRNGCNYT